MSVFQDKERGTWIVKYRVKNPITLQWQQKLKRGFATKRDAKAYEASILNEPFTASQTFKEMADEYLSTLTIKTSSRESYVGKIEKYVTFKDKKMKDITKPMLMSWHIDLIKNGQAPATNNKTIQMVRSVYKYANNVYDVPNISTILKRVKGTNKEMEVWTKEEFDNFIQYISNPIMKAFFTTLFMTGMRKGEAKALLKTDLNKDILNIDKAMRRDETDTTKTESSVRKIRIDKDTLKLLEPLKERKGKYLFGDEHPLSNTNIDYYFNEGIKKSGNKKIRIHDLRHSHATILINGGVNIVAVSKRLGHKDINTTLKVYTHLLEKSNDEMLNFLNKL